MMKVLSFLKGCFLTVKNFIQFDSLLHFLACAIIVFTFFPILDNVGNAVIVATVVAFTKEYIDIFIKRSNNFKQSLKDILFDALGIVYAVLFLCYIY